MEKMDTGSPNKDSFAKELEKKKKKERMKEVASSFENSPKNVGEGIQAMGKAIASVMARKKSPKKS